MQLYQCPSVKFHSLWTILRPELSLAGPQTRRTSMFTNLWPEGTDIGQIELTLAMCRPDQDAAIANSSPSRVQMWQSIVGCTPDIGSEESRRYISQQARIFCNRRLRPAADQQGRSGLLTAELTLQPEPAGSISANRAERTASP